MSDPRLRTIATTHGVFLRAEAVALGYSKRDFDRAYRSGAWVRVHHGCYTFPDIWAAAGDEERHRIRARAVLRTHGPGATLTHASALLELGADVWGYDLSKPHVTLTQSKPGGRPSSAHYHVGVLPEDHVELVEGVPRSTPARAAVEHAMVANLESGLVSVDWVLAQGLASQQDMLTVHEGLGQWPGSRTAALAIRLGRAGGKSVGETRARFLMYLAGLPMPELQYVVHDARGVLIGITDFAWPAYGVLGEFDGRVKYERYLREGDAAGDAVMREKLREDRLREETGWRVIRLTWADLYDVPRTVSRLRRVLLRAA